jgi:transposase
VHLLECGLLAGSFIPPADIKAARDVVRYRTKIVQQRTSEIARLGNVLQDAQGSRSTPSPPRSPPSPGGR